MGYETDNAQEEISDEIPQEALDAPIFKLKSVSTSKESVEASVSTGSISQDSELRPALEKKSLSDLLSDPDLIGTEGNPRCTLKPIAKGADNRYILLNLQTLYFNDKECFILTMRDVTAIRDLEESEKKNFFVNLVTSSVSHELMTPLKCIMAFSTEI